RAARAMAGLAQAGLMFCDLDRAEGSALAALAGADPADAATRAMALRVIGVLEGERGEVDAAVAHCREAVDLAPAPHHRALATAYLALTLFEVGRTGEAISAGLEGST